ncbi:MAG: GNAT family N-acetyltransferase [Pseudomonadales bacterium]
MTRQPDEPDPFRAFSTEDVRIRAVEPEDYEALRDIYAQPNAYYGTLQMPFPSAHTWRERLKQAATDRYSLVACIDDRPVGNIGLIPSPNPRRRHSAGIGMGVHDAFAGRGIGTALMNAVLDLADNWLNVRRLELTVYADNARAIRLYERSGFVAEGAHRDYAFRDGALVDAVAMARLRPQNRS